MKNFPEYTENKSTGEKGITFLKSFVENELGWIFRVNHQEHDFGIDCFLDILIEKKYVCGKSIAAQVKTGDSFFKEKNSTGYVYRGETKHLNYLSNLDIATVIILVNLSTQKIYWQIFNPRLIEKAGENWKLTIPFSNVMDNKFELSIKKYITPIKNYVSVFEKYWELNETMKKSDIFMVLIGKNDIASLHFNKIEALFARFQDSPEIINAMKSKVRFYCDGYDDDQRELYTIPEVRNWFRLAFHRIRYWLYFFDLEDEALSFNMFLSCLSTVRPESNQKQIILEPEEVIQNINDLFFYLKEFQEKHDLDKNLIANIRDNVLKKYFEGAMVTIGGANASAKRF